MRGDGVRPRLQYEMAGRVCGACADQGTCWHLGHMHPVIYAILVPIYTTYLAITQYGVSNITMYACFHYSM